MVIIDSFESATPSVQEWLAKEFLVPISKKSQVKVVIAGITTPQPATSWEDRSQVHELNSVSKEDCMAFCNELGIEQDEKVIGEFIMYFQGKPGTFVQYAAWRLALKEGSNS